MTYGQIWNRVAQRIRAYRTVDSPLSKAMSTEGMNGGAPAPDDTGAAMVLSPPTDRSTAGEAQRALSAMRQSYDQVVNLVESIRAHLDVQQKRSAEMADSLNRLADNVAQLPRAAVRQSDAIAALASQLESGAVRTQRLDNSLAQVPVLLEAQRRQEARVVDTLHHLTEAMNALSSAEATSAGAAERLLCTAAEREEQLLKLYAEQTRRLTWVLTGTIAMAVLSTVLAVVAIFG